MPDASTPPPVKVRKSPSLFTLRFRRFRRLKRGWYSFLILIGTYLLSFFLPFFMGQRAIVVSYQGAWYYPAFKSYLYDTFGFTRQEIHLAKVFGQNEVDGKPQFGETDYRALKKQFADQKQGNWVWLPLFSSGPNESFLARAGNPPYPPSWDHWFGTDDRGRDILVRLAYGYRISISFSLLVTAISYVLGVLTGAVFGYCGSWVDIVGVRLIEIWGSIPFLYTVIILAAIFKPSFILLVVILSAFGWMGIAYYIRGEFLREKSRDYVAGAMAVGEGHWTIITHHILPNSLTPIITFAPFAIVAGITSLVALDFLGFGLPAPTPSWGELLGQWKANYREWHLAVFPLLAMFITLQLIVFIGESIREAFDPKVFSRLR